MDPPAITNGEVISRAILSLFGVIIGWIITNSNKNVAGGASDPSLICIFLLVLLSAIVFAEHVTSQNVRMIASYLRIKKLSDWESDVAAFQHNNRLSLVNQRTARHILFVVLGVLSVVTPYVMQGKVIRCADLCDVRVGLHLLAMIGFLILVRYSYKSSKSLSENLVKLAYAS